VGGWPPAPDCGEIDLSAREPDHEADDTWEKKKAYSCITLLNRSNSDLRIRVRWRLEQPVKRSTNA
jgi:hypothetical protein